MTRRRRIALRELLDDPSQRREMMIDTIIATQAREGIHTTREEAERAYDRVQRERARMARARMSDNPGLLDALRPNQGGAGAEATFERFHARGVQPVYPFHRRSDGVFDLPSSVQWPERVGVAGQAIRTLYESDKWHDINDTTQYYHDHDKGCVFYVPAADGEEFPFEYPDEVMLIGECIGFVFKGPDGGLNEGVMKGKNILVSSPDAWIDSKKKNHVFLAIINLDGGGVEALITGPRLRITSHGIEG
jgi:hypothetical protein